MSGKIPKSEISDFESDFEHIVESDDIIVETEKAMKQLFHSHEELERGIQKVISAFEYDLAQKEKMAGEEAFAKFQSLIPTLRGPIEPDRPTFLHELPLWVAKRSKEKLSSKKLVMDENRLLDFVGHAGDKPLNHYKFSDFQKFADLLVRVPANFKKKPDLKDFSLTEVADFNDALPEKKRHETLVGKSIQDNYLSPLKVFFQAMAVTHDFRSPLTDGVVRVSSAAKEGIERSPLTVADLNKWFTHAAGQKRSDEKWLPLLGTLTGARVGELINLQGKDILQIESGEFIFDLTQGILERDGSTSKRKTKNKTSRRYIALHEQLLETGFIKYAQSRLPDEWIFPEGHRWGGKIIKNPSDAASKRMNRQLQDIGVHRPLEVVFHSTRHTAKDFMRIAKVDKRTADMQTGHAFFDVADSYGSKRLRDDEIEYLAAMPLPDGLDFSPYVASKTKRG